MHPLRLFRQERIYTLEGTLDWKTYTLEVTLDWKTYTSSSFTVSEETTYNETINGFIVRQSMGLLRPFPLQLPQQSFTVRT